MATRRHHPDAQQTIDAFRQGVALSLMVGSLLLSGFAPLMAQFENVRVTDPRSNDPEEVTVAINPANPLNLVAGANLRYYYYSLDGGKLWQQKLLPIGTYGDPCVIFDANGRVYYAHLTDSRPIGQGWIDRMTIHRSSNGGQTWFDSVTVGLNGTKAQDKEWLASDMTQSSFRGNLYMAWTEFDVYGSANPQDSTRILFSRSTDGGTTWSSPVRISDKGGDCVDSDNTVEGAVPAVGPNGEVYVAWAGPRGMEFDKSTDGGITFGNDVAVTSMPGGWDFNVSGIYRCNGLPVTACDVSNSPYRGTVYINWSDQRNGVDNTDIYLVKSTNGGQTWGPVKRVNDDAGTRQQFFTWMTIDQTTGNIFVIFYDRRNTVGDSTDVYVARSVDGGETFANFKVSQSSFKPVSSIFFGDYTNIAAMNGKVFPIWMRMDGTALSVWTALIDATPSAVRASAAGVSEYELGQNFPNPFNPSTTIRVALPRGGPARLVVYDALGRTVATLLDGELRAGIHHVRFYADNLPAGVYYYRLQASTFTESKKLILMK
jgi:hypothetical protein